MAYETVKILEEAAKTYAERNAVYGDNFVVVGSVMAAMFPRGVTLTTADDWNRLHILLLGVVKQTRYVENWSRGGHQDSIRDHTVYGAMLEAIDREISSRGGEQETDRPDDVFDQRRPVMPRVPTHSQAAKEGER